ncbi:MAG: hypothetical protein ACK4HW_06200 [Roseinatronobacter sp.]
MNIVATTPESTTPQKTGRSVWLLKVPLELRPILGASFAGDDLSYPSIRHPDGSFTDTIPAPLMNRILTERPNFLALWHDLKLPSEDSAALLSSGVHVFRLDHAALLGPVPDTAYLPRPYGLRLKDAPADMTGGVLAASEVAALLARYRALELTAVTEPGKLALPVQAQQLLKSPSVMVVAEDDRGQPTSLRDLIAWRDLLRRARSENPGQTITFLTNGRVPPLASEPAQVAVLTEIQAQADIICSERWNVAFLKECRALYTRGASAAFDTMLADLRSVVTEPGPLQDLAEGTRSAEDVFAELFLNETVFGDPVHGRALPRGMVFDIIAARRDLLPPAPLPATLRWPNAGVPGKEVVLPLPGFAGSTATFTHINPTQTLDAPKSLIAPDWLAPNLVVPDGANAQVVMLQGDRLRIAELAKDNRSVAELTLHPTGRKELIERFARYQPALYLETLRTSLRKSGLKKALISDISAARVRLFARACAMEGVERAYFPPWIAQPKAVASLRALADVAFVWEPSQTRALLSQGKFASERLREVRLQTASSPREDIVLWLGETGLSLSRLKAVVAEALAVAELMDRPMVFALGREALEKFDAATFERIAFHPLASYKILNPQIDGSASALESAALVVTSESETIALADQLGCTSRPLLPLGNSEKDLTSDQVRAHLRTELLGWLDSSFGTEARRAPRFAQAQDLATTLAEWVNAAPLARASVFRPENVSWAIGTVSESTLRNQSRYMIPALGVGRYSEVKFENAPHDFLDADVLFQWGLRVTNHKARADQTARGLNIPVVNLEDGFIRSIGIGLSGETSVSVCFDDATAFYDATRPSQLETWINRGVALTEEEHIRARAVIDRIAAKKVTKYNFAPYVPIARPDPTRKAILVVDQRAGDVSIEKGLASPETFVRMVDAALAFADTHDILIKTHPDANIGGKDSAIGGETLARAAQHPAVTLVTEDMNPYSLIDIVEKVFVVSSGMGFEALLGGREVWCFGAPFYAGWGLTRDHVALPRRTARPTLEAVFHAFYIEHTRYYDPIADRPGEIEAAIDYILLQRPWSLARCKSAEPRFLGQQPPRDARAVALTEAYDHIWLLGFPAGYQVWLNIHLPGTPHVTRFDDSVIAGLAQAQSPALVVFDGTAQPGMQAVAARKSIPIIHARPGLARWTDVQAADASPYTLTLDAQGLPQFDLEHLLQTHDFAADPALLTRAAALGARVASLGLEDAYTLPRHPDPHGPKLVQRVLVLGQRGGGQRGMPEISEVEVIARAQAEHPDAQVIYHTNDPAAPELATIQTLAQVSTVPLCPDDLFDGVDHVYTIDADDGFVALLRGLPVTTFGTPIYAGWGLTDDRSAQAARARSLELDALVAGLLLLHPIYLDPETGTGLEPEDVLARLERTQEVAKLAAL